MPQACRDVGALCWVMDEKCKTPLWHASYLPSAISDRTRKDQPHDPKEPVR